MGSLIAGMPIGFRLPAGLAGDAAPYVPSAPVQIGTSGPRPGVAEVGSWQALLVMFGLVLVLGAAVLMYAVRQRARLLERRRVRRMGEAVALMAAMDDLGGGIGGIGGIGEISGKGEIGTTGSTGGIAVPVTTLTPPAPPRTTSAAPAAPGRPAPNA